MVYFRGFTVVRPAGALQNENAISQKTFFVSTRLDKCKDVHPVSTKSEVKTQYFRKQNANKVGSKNLILSEVKKVKRTRSAEAGRVLFRDGGLTYGNHKIYNKFINNYIQAFDPNIISTKNYSMLQTS